MVVMERYRKGRLTAEFSLMVETASGPVMASVVDVNEYGMRLCGNFDVEAGEDITATLTTWEISGLIKWARRPYCGILFDTRAPEEAVQELRGSAVAPPAPRMRRIQIQDML